MTEVMVEASPNEIQAEQPAASPTDHVRHISNDNKEILTVPLVLLAFSIIVVGLRVWTRARMVKFFGMDDYWILGALASNIASTMLAVAGTFKGQGSHINDLEDGDLIYVLKLLYAEVILQPITLNLIKLSILSFYLRLPGSHRFLVLTKSTFVFVAAMMIAFTLTLALACIPVSRQWDPYETRGRCINRSLFWHVILSFNVASNLWVLLLPTRMFLALKVTKRQKVMVLCIFGCGLIATIASILALAELPLAINDPDKTWGSWRLAVYAAVENNLGIIAASAPALKPLLGRTAKKVRSTVGSKLSTTPLWSSSRGGTGGGESHGSSGVKRSKASSAGIATGNSTTSQTWTQRWSLAENEKHGFHISEVVRRIISPRGSVVSGGSRSNTSRTGNTSFHTALASRTHRDSALLDTIGILPTHAAFPRNTRRGTRSFAGSPGGDEYGGVAEIHHIRDWQLDQNDYCLDPNVEHNLPQRPKRVYNRISIDSNPRGLLDTNRNLNMGESDDGIRRMSLVDSINSAVSPTEVARSSALETCGEYEATGEAEQKLDHEAEQSTEQVMSHEAWRNSGGYV